MTPNPHDQRLDEGVVRRAVEAWIASYRHVTARAGRYRVLAGPTADEVIVAHIGAYRPPPRAIGMTARDEHRRRYRALYRAYEAAARKQACDELGIDFNVTYSRKQEVRPRRRYRRVTDGERALILDMLNKGHAIDRVARHFDRSPLTVLNIRRAG